MELVMKFRESSVERKKAYTPVPKNFPSRWVKPLTGMTTVTLLVLLLASYNHEIASMNARAKIDLKELTAKVVTELSTDEYQRRARNQSAKSDQEEGFAANANKEDIDCHNYKKRGHVKAGCWAPAGGKEGQSPTRRGTGQGTDSAASAGADTNAWAAIIDWSDDN